MPLMTVKELTDNILNDLEALPVDTIDETEESRMVVEIIKRTYFKLIDSREWPFLFNMFKLVPTGATKPVEMSIPRTVTKVKYIKYNRKLVAYLEPQKFMNIIDSRNNADPNVVSFTDTSGVPLSVLDNVDPTFYTIFEEGRAIFDSYDANLGTNLLEDSTQGYGQIYPTWTDSDGDFTPDLPIDAFSLLLEDAKSSAFITLKQTSNPKTDFNSASLKATQVIGAWKGRRNHPIVDTTIPAGGGNNES